MYNLVSQDKYTENLYPTHQLGTLGVDRNGDRFRYVKAGASALVAANLLQEAAEDTALLAMFSELDTNKDGYLSPSELENHN
jgi:hypothetical protein